jgi:hypothetical protein
MRKKTEKKADPVGAGLHGDRNLPDGDILERMRNERVRTEEEIFILMKEAGKGLFQSQVELKQAPWKVVWLKQDLMIERQEKIIELLSNINRNMERFLAK